MTDTLIPVVKERRGGVYTLVIRAATLRQAGKLAEDAILEQLGRHAEGLALRPEIQVRGQRIAVYPAGRNVTIQDAKLLAELYAFARRVAGI